jgi:Uma2 family endonuclease
MDAMTATAHMSADEFLARGEDPNGRRWQLIDGELVMNEPTWTHNDSAEPILYALGSWVRAAPARGRAGFPLDVRMDDRNVYAPDVVWYRDGRQPERGDPPPYPVPDLVVEVRSPSTWRYDVGAKKANYERHGAAELWLVDTAADVVLVFRRSDPNAPHFDVSLELTADDKLTSPSLPGFALAVSAIFGEV